MKSNFFLLAVFLLLSCIESTYVGPEDELVEETSNKQDEDTLITEKKDSVVVRCGSNVDTLVSVEDTTVKQKPSIKEGMGGVYVNLNVGIGARVFKSEAEFLGLAKTKTDRVQLVEYRKSKVNYVEFVFYDSTETVRRFVQKQKIENGLWVGVIMVPPGLYEVKVNLYYGRQIPWASSWIFDESFEAYDSVDLRVKSTDTIDAVFRELECMDYLVKIKNAPGKYTIGKKYQVAERTRMYYGEKALFDSSGNLCYALHCPNIDKTNNTISILSDTGQISFSFWFDLNTVMNDDVVDVDGQYALPGKSIWDHEAQLMAVDAVSYSGRGVTIKYNRNTFIYPNDSTFSLQIIGPLPSERDVALDGQYSYNVGSIDWSFIKNISLGSGAYVVRTSGAIDQYYRNLDDNAALHIASLFVDTLYIP
jgi:hypothetical protein